MLNRLWHKAFLEERPSVSLGFFRMAVAFTVGAHVVPTLLHLDDNYLSTAFKEKNVSFFPIGFLSLVDKSPDALVVFMTGLFLVSVVCFALGFLTQASCIVMTACCYYFYALNSLHIGTLSYDILLVTLFLMCVTPYPGDSLSLDAKRKRRSFFAAVGRPVFLQRLLQLQVASTFFYTGLSKITAHGNWIGENPIYYLLNSTSESVVKSFPLRAFFAARPEWCHAIGLGIVAFELSLGVLIFVGRTRTFYVAAGCLFMLLLLVTLHVPTIFFFLFPPQLLLFIEPEKVTELMRRLRKTPAR